MRMLICPNFHDLYHQHRSRFTGSYMHHYSCLTLPYSRGKNMFNIARKLVTTIKTTSSVAVLAGAEHPSPPQTYSNFLFWAPSLNSMAAMKSRLLRVHDKLHRRHELRVHPVHCPRLGACRRKCCWCSQPFSRHRHRLVSGVPRHEGLWERAS